MKWKLFIESYFTNLFILWEILLLIMDALKGIQPVDNFRTILWENQGYYIILVPLTLTEFCFDVMVIINNKEFYSKIQNNYLKYYFLSILAMFIITDFVLFRVGIIAIIADQHPVVITNKQNFQFWTTMAYLMIYSVIPLGHYFVLWFFKRRFSVKTEFNHNRFKIDLTPVVFVICMAFNSALIIITVQNYANGLLK